MQPLVITLGVLVVATALSGCLASSVEPAALRSTQRGDMTAEESETTDEGMEGGRYYAERAVTARGTMTLDTLPADLSTVNGNIDVAGREGEAWSALFTLRGEGASQEAARENLERITLEWSHTDGARHFLNAAITMERPAQGGPSIGPIQLPNLVQVGSSGGQSGNIAVVLPSSVLASLAARTVNGNLGLAGLRTDVLELETTNGNVDAEAGIASAELAATNGNLQLRLTPWRSGAVGASTTNGNVALEVPEDARHGYDVEARTTNGQAEVGLRDGQRGGEEGRVTFRTDGFESREIQTRIVAESVNGNVAVG